LFEFVCGKNDKRKQKRETDNNGTIVKMFVKEKKNIIKNYGKSVFSHRFLVKYKYCLHIYWGDITRTKHDLVGIKKISLYVHLFETI